MLNRKVLVRILTRAEQAGELRALTIREVDDGMTAVQAMQEEMDNERCFDLVLIDNVMVVCLLVSVEFYCSH